MTYREVAAIAFGAAVGSTLMGVAFCVALYMLGR